MKGSETPSSSCCAPPDPAGSLEDAVRQRYADGAREVEPGLCCPEADYDAELLEVIPEEIRQKDYGCGDPSAHARAGDTVLDLGSGGGKVCYILAQKVGSSGRVIGVDFNDAMLELARKYQEEVADRLGYANVSFHKARIQDLAGDLEQAAEYLARQPIQTVEDLDRFRAWQDRQRAEAPLIPDGSVDLIVSNCVLNLVHPADKPLVFREMHRVLKPGGRVVISDIVSDEDVPLALQEDPELWSGCISGAFREDRFLEAFEEAGFAGIEILRRQSDPWKVVGGVEFRAVTVRAWKPESGPCLERYQAVVYAGPWKAVIDDDGHRLERGRPMAVCDKTYRFLTQPHGPYAGQLFGMAPAELVPLDEAEPFDCKQSKYRDVRYLKSRVSPDDTSSSCGCGDGGCC